MPARLREGIWWQKIASCNNNETQKLHFPNTCELNSPPPHPPREQKYLVSQGLLIIESSRLHSDTSHSVGLLWTSDQPDEETSTWQHKIITTNIHAAGGIRTRNPSKRVAAGSIELDTLIFPVSILL